MKPLKTVLLAAATSLAVLVPGQADAGSYYRPDATKDVVSETEAGVKAAAPERTEGDIVGSSVSHLPRRVVAAASFTSLSGAPDFAGHVFRVLTNKGRVREVTLVAGPGLWGGKAFMETGRGRAVKCKVGRSIDYAKERVTVSIPRRCLGKPRWVRVGIGTVTSEPDKAYGDDALTRGEVGNVVTLGPRVFRG